MPLVGFDPYPLRVAIVGSGPAAFYAASQLLGHDGLSVEVDMFERLPTPYGLVRAGVAPDHENIKAVTRKFAEVATDPRFRFYGFVEFGKDVSLTDLRNHYHQIVFATGAQGDKRMGIPGEDLAGSYPASDFVAWYNGHPDYRDCEFDLTQERVAIVGAGNVAVDVARILCLTADELAGTDIAEHARHALAQSRIREVHVLARRGPAQASFTNPEIKELANLADADVTALSEEVRLDDLSLMSLKDSGDRITRRKVEILQGYASVAPEGRRRRVVLRFLVSRLELVGDRDGHVSALRLVRNRLLQTTTGSITSEPTDHVEELEAGLVFRAVGYRGTGLPGVPMNERWGVILNRQGRVIEAGTQQPVVGEYCAGWIKRGPNGVIGTNKTDAEETVGAMLEDLAEGSTLRPSAPAVGSAESLVRERQPRYVSWSDWLRLDEIEVRSGRAHGRPRDKFTRTEDMLAALGA